jgi:hypothetical protein
MTISRNISVMAQGASSSGILAGGYGGLGASISPTTAGNVIFTADGSAWSSTAKIVRGTSVATTSGTSVTFSSIPSWVKRITVMLNGVSTNGTSLLQVQIGSGSVTTTGYLSYATITTGGSNPTLNTSTTGFNLAGASAANIYYSTLTIINISGFVYLNSISGGLFNGTAGYTTAGGGNVTLSGALDRVVLTTVNGTDAFDAGSVNILYE